MTTCIQIQKKYDTELGCYWSLFVETATGGMFATSANYFAQCWQLLIDEDFI